MNIEKELIETERALIDLWKAFCPPRTAEEMKAAMDKHQAVIDRILERKRG